MLSVVMTTFNRAHLIERSFECYARQTFKDFEIIVLDDDSTDNTYEICRKWQSKLNLVYTAFKKPDGQGWRDAASIINYGLRAAKGDFIIPTFSEVMPGFRAIEIANMRKRDDCFISARIYFMNYGEQALLDTVDWKNEGTKAVRRLPNFYDVDEGRPINHYHHRVVEEPDYCMGSWVFGGMTRKTWKRIGGMSEHTEWGSVDITFLHRRTLLGISTFTMANDDTYCIHQNHDGPMDAISPRNHDNARNNAIHYNSAEEAILNNM